MYSNVSRHDSRSALETLTVNALVSFLYGADLSMRTKGIVPIQSIFDEVR